MSTGRVRGDRPTPARIVAAVLLPVLLAPVLTACGDDRPSAPSGEADTVRQITRTLEQRARALRGGDQLRFRRTVGRADDAFAASQRTYFSNLQQLPVRTLRYRVDADSVQRDGDDYWAEVEVHLRLAGYDAAPVVTHDRYRFTPADDRHRLLLVSTTDEEWEAEHRPLPQPWDLGEVVVEESGDVLGVFDVGTAASADRVLAAVAAGHREVATLLPGTRPTPGVPGVPGVVVYVLADPAFLESVPGLPVSDPQRLDAATIPVPRDAADPDGEAASYRILLNPRILEQPDPVLDRLVRHELAHVVLGDRGQDGPLWLTEGVAEYVSVLPLAPSERRLPAEALDLAAEGVEDLPEDEAFAGPDAEAWYAVGWWVCEYLASTYGEAVLWTLLDDLGEADGRAARDRVIEEELGVTSAELVAEGVGLMERTYG